MEYRKEDCLQVHLANRGSWRWSNSRDIRGRSGENGGEENRGENAGEEKGEGKGVKKIVVERIVVKGM
jgi:hypothetical protein